MWAIEAISLRKEYGRTVAVADLDLQVRQGEVFGFLGANGAGKTTTVKMLLGLVRPSAGQALVLGRKPGDPNTMVHIGFLPEHFRFHPWLTAVDFLDYHARLYDMPAVERRRRIPQLLERVGLAGWERTRLAKFSKGMLQRIGLAQALLNHPQIVFLDEPTSGLDPLGRREVRDLIRELRDTGVTVFLNSHMLGEVEAVCDRVGIIRQGKLVCVGTLEELAGGVLQVEIHAQGLTPELMEGLGRWGHVVRWENAGRVTLEVADEEALPAVAAWLVESGARLYALTPKRRPLEDLFVQIVEGEQ